MSRKRASVRYIRSKDRIKRTKRAGIALAHSGAPRRAPVLRGTGQSASSGLRHSDEGKPGKRAP